MDFLIPITVQSFQHHHWKIIYLPLGNILKYWSEIMQEASATILIIFMWQHTSIMNTKLLNYF